MLTIFLAVWLVGWVATIYPLNQAIVRSHVRAKVKSAHDKGHVDIDTDRAVPAIAAVLSTIIGAFWPIGAPFYLSHLVYTRQRPTIDRQLDRHTDTEFGRDLLRRQMAEARKELQAEIGVGEIVDEKGAYDRDFRRSLVEAKKELNHPTPYEWED